jgi:hypothetical protein
MTLSPTNTAFALGAGDRAAYPWPHARPQRTVVEPSDLGEILQATAAYR